MGAPPRRARYPPLPVGNLQHLPLPMDRRLPSPVGRRRPPFLLRLLRLGRRFPRPTGCSYRPPILVRLLRRRCCLPSPVGRRHHSRSPLRPLHRRRSVIRAVDNGRDLPSLWGRVCHAIKAWAQVRLLVVIERFKQRRDECPL